MATATATAKKAPAKKAAAKKTAVKPASKSPAAEKVPAATNGHAVTDSEAYANLSDATQRAEWMDRAVLFDLVAKLVAERNRIEMTQAEMARHLGVKQPALSLIESHKQAPTVSQLQRYARHIGLRLVMDVNRW